MIILIFRIIPGWSWSKLGGIGWTKNIYHSLSEQLPYPPIPHLIIHIFVNPKKNFNPQFFCLCFDPTFCRHNLVWPKISSTSIFFDPKFVWPKFCLTKIQVIYFNSALSLSFSWHLFTYSINLLFQLKVCKQSILKTT